jgi:hypothetical protein
MTNQVRMPDSGFRSDQVGELLQAFDALDSRP